MAAMKEMFRDAIQNVMEIEIDEEPGRERCERSSEPDGPPRDYHTGYAKKTVKTLLGEADIKLPRDRNDSFAPKIIGKYNWNADDMNDKILALYACHESGGYRRADHGTVWCGNLSETCNENQRKDHAGRYGRVKLSAGAGVSVCAHRMRPFFQRHS